MNLKKTVILFGLVVAMMAAGKIVFAQEALDQEAITSNQPPSAQKEGDLQWAWGEVTNLDNQAKTVTLKYLDYETDQEKELVLVVDEKTAFENIKDFSELKLNDTLSIDYMIAEDNKNIAKNINFEKPEVPAASAASETAVPSLAQPIAQPAIPAVDSTIAANEAPVPSEPTLAPAPAEPALADSESAPVVQGQAQ